MPGSPLDCAGSGSLHSRPEGAVRDGVAWSVRDGVAQCGQLITSGDAVLSARLMAKKKLSREEGLSQQDSSSLTVAPPGLRELADSSIHSPSSIYSPNTRLARDLRNGRRRCSNESRSLAPCSAHDCVRMRLATEVSRTLATRRPSNSPQLDCSSGSLHSAVGSETLTDGDTYQPPSLEQLVRGETYRPIKSKARLSAVWVLLVLLILFLCLLIVLYSVAPCRKDRPCFREAAVWAGLSETWALTLGFEAVIEDPLFILVAVMTRQALVSCICCELIFKNRDYILCCAPCAYILEWVESVLLCCCV